MSQILPQHINKSYNTFSNLKPLNYPLHTWNIFVSNVMDFFGGYGSRIFFYFCYLFNGKLSSNLIFFPPLLHGSLSKFFITLLTNSLTVFVGTRLPAHNMAPFSQSEGQKFNDRASFSANQEYSCITVNLPCLVMLRHIINRIWCNSIS